MKVFLVNLDRDRQRLDHMCRQFEMVGVPFCRIAGIDGTAGNVPTYDPSQFESPGAVGCFLSHKKTWTEIANLPEKEVAAIFEDDAHLSPTIRGFLATDEWVPKDADIVRFETTFHSMRQRGPAVETLDGIRIRRAYFNAWGAAGYVLRSETARWLSQLPARFHQTPDQFLFSRKNSPIANLLSVYQLTPALCIQDKYAVDGRMNFASNLLYKPVKQGVLAQARQAIRPVARLILRRQLVPFAGAN